MRSCAFPSAARRSSFSPTATRPTCAPSPTASSTDSSRDREEGPITDQSGSPRERVRVGVLGAGAWARGAHLPGYARDQRCEVVAIADPQIELARKAADEFTIPTVTASHEDLFSRDDIDLIDVCTPSATHFDLAWGALSAGKHVLCEKPVAYDYRDTVRAAELARSKGLKTKLGFTFRY